MCEGGVFAGDYGNSDGSSLYTHTPGKIGSITMVMGFPSSILRHIVALQAHNSISEDRAHTTHSLPLDTVQWDSAMQKPLPLYMCKSRRSSIWPLTDIPQREFSIRVWSDPIT